MKLRGETSYKISQELTKIATVGHLNSKLIFTHKNKGNTLEILTQKHRDHHWPTGNYSQQLD